MNKFFFLVLLGSCSLSQLPAQQYVDLFRGHYHLSPNNHFEGHEEARNIQELAFTLRAGTPISEKSTLIFGVYGEAINTPLMPDQSPLRVYGLNPQLGLKVKHSERWSGTYMLLPKWMGSRDGIAAKDFQIGGLALFSYQSNEHLTYRIGGYYNHEFFGPFFVPVLGLYYLSPNEDWEVNLSLPIRADINRRLSTRSRLGLEFNGNVRSYNLHDEHSGQYLAKSSSEVYGYLRYDLSRSIIMQGQVGYSVGRYYRLYDENDAVTMGISAFRLGDDRVPLNHDLSDGLLLRLQLIYRYYP